MNVVESFPEECRFVLETLAKVYKHDETARDEKMSPAERLAFHQAQSGSLMETLHDWMVEQLETKKTERNCSLGQAMSYTLKHWAKLTLFLREPGAPLDNNICEIALKKAIIHRKNSLFFKTKKGAYVGDIFMSLIYTCQLSGADPFDYLTQLQLHAAELAQAPQDWMPWNYRETLERLLGP